MYINDRHIQKSINDSEKYFSPRNIWCGLKVNVAISDACEFAL